MVADAGMADDIRARGHQFENALIAELDHLFDQLSLVAIQDSFFLGLLDERFDTFLRRFGRGRDLFVGNVGHGNCQIQDRAERASL